MTSFDEILAIYSRAGGAAYYGEPVTQAAHALQAAYFAARAGAPPALVAAALLHDIGHLIEPVPEDLADWSHDAEHELAGSRWLAARFGPAVTEPVRLHVAAKRWLCATQPDYAARLSAASVATLVLQGGPMRPEEAAAFAAEAHGRDAVRLRRWDDEAKQVGLAVPDFAAYRGLIQALAVGAPAPATAAAAADFAARARPLK